MQSMVPSTVMSIGSGTPAFIEATDYMVENDIPATQQLLQDLQVAFQMRVAHHQYGGGDEDGACFIAIFQYCWQT